MISPADLRSTFTSRHGTTPRAFFAPGRVNLIGEHTDYNDGLVLPVALELGITVLGASRADRRVCITSCDLGESAEFDLDAPGPGRTGTWIDYAEGVAQALVAAGQKIGGADLVIASDLPAGAGLSSSAALEVSVGFALLSLAALPVDRVALALAGQSAEHRYVGTRCGIMDQLVSARARLGAALLIDCRSLELTDVPLPGPPVSILVADTRVKHSLASSEYNTRRDECEQAVEILRGSLPEIRALRDVSLRDIEDHGHLLPDSILRRARHVITENARVFAAVDALSRGDLQTVGRLFVESHRSLQHDYEVSVQELDLLVDTAIQQPGVYGARMTGGGFGGSIVALVDDSHLTRVQAAMRDAYVTRFGREPGFLVTRGGAGVCEIA